MALNKQKQDDQLEYIYSSYVRIRDVGLKTCQKRWMIGRSGERGSGISVLAARYDDDDENLFLRKKSSWPRAALDLAWVVKGEEIPDSAAPKCDFLLFVKNY